MIFAARLGTHLRELHAKYKKSHASGAKQLSAEESPPFNIDSLLLTVLNRPDPIESPATARNNGTKYHDNLEILPHQAVDTSSVSICVYNAPMVANVVFLILGAVIGIALGYFFAASRKTVATETDNSELISLRQDSVSARTQVEELTRRLEDAERRAAGLIQFQTQAAAAQALSLIHI